MKEGDTREDITMALQQSGCKQKEAVKRVASVINSNKRMCIKALHTLFTASKEQWRETMLSTTNVSPHGLDGDRE